MKRSLRWSWAILVVLTLLLASCDGTPTPAPKLTVWHAWQEADLEVLNNVAASYQKSSGIAVDLVAFTTPNDLLTNLLAADELPDVFIGYHTWAKDLLDKGIINAYCLPDQCQECQGPNPPPWCPYAMGDFSQSIIDDFAMTVGYCEPDQCPECFGANPPPWCRLATQDFGVTLDVLQASFAGIFNDDVFPFGIPIWWEYITVFQNPEVAGDPSPQPNLPEVIEVAEEFGVYYDPDFFSRIGVGIPAVIQAMGNPSPQPSIDGVGILAASSDQFGRLQQQVGQLVPIGLVEVPPQILVHGAFMNAGSNQRTQALDFIYLLADEETQLQLVDKGAHLPADGRVMGAVITDGRVLPPIFEIGKQGVLISKPPTGAR